MHEYDFEPLENKIQRLLLERDGLERSVEEILRMPRWLRICLLQDYNERYKSDPPERQLSVEEIISIYGI